MVLLFDLDDTLLDHGTAAARASADFHARFRDALRMDRETFEARWRALMKEGFRRYAAGELSHVGQRRYRMRGLFDEPLSDAEADARFDCYLREYERHWALFDDVWPCLEALNGTRVGVITNGSATHQAKKLARTGLAGRFECVITPGDGLLGKPHASIFERAAQALGVSPAHCTYVGDQLEIDARGARDAGMRGVWLDRARTPGSQDVPVCHDLHGLLLLLADGR